MVKAVTYFAFRFADVNVPVLKVVEVWKRCRHGIDAPLTRSLVLACIYMLHMEVLDDYDLDRPLERDQSPVHTISDKRFQYLHRFDRWVPCVCHVYRKGQKCSVLWNFANDDKWGMFRHWTRIIRCPVAIRSRQKRSKILGHEVGVAYKSDLSNIETQVAMSAHQHNFNAWMSRQSS